MDELRKQAESSSQTRASFPTPKPAFTSLELDSPKQRARLPHGMEIDLGGIAKGWIVERTAKLLNQYADVCAVNAGGDIFFIGEPLDGYGWEVYLEDPRDPSQVLLPLNVRSGAVATSSVTKRTWSQNDNTWHHLIDPRTGKSANSEWLSVTVFHPSLVKAEVFAKAILIGGVGEVRALLENQPDVTYLAVDQNGHLSGSEHSKEFLYEFEINPR
jgi:thiamine biosynthesis lipoprotein